MIEQRVAAASQADLDLAVRIIAAIEGCQPAVDYREAALTFIKQSLDGPQELFGAAEEIVMGLCDDAAVAVLAARPDLPIDRQRLAAFVLRQVSAIAAFGEGGAARIDLPR
jgi:hypothetical protein